MILFVDHNTECLPPIHHHRAANTLGSVLPADQMALDKDLALERGKFLETFGK